MGTTMLWTWCEISGVRLMKKLLSLICRAGQVRQAGGRDGGTTGR